MSRPHVTDATVKGLKFARACVLDQRAASHDHNDHQWDKQYDEALAALNAIFTAHEKSTKKARPRGRQSS